MSYIDVFDLFIFRKFWVLFSSCSGAVISLSEDRPHQLYVLWIHRLFLLVLRIKPDMFCGFSSAWNTGQFHFCCWQEDVLLPAYLSNWWCIDRLFSASEIWSLLIGHSLLLLLLLRVSNILLSFKKPVVSQLLHTVSPIFLHRNKLICLLEFVWVRSS